MYFVIQLIRIVVHSVKVDLRKRGVCMKAVFETVEFPNNCPAVIEQLSGRIDVPSHWHKEPELIYLLDGALSLTASEREFALSADDVLLINAQANHCFSGEGRLLTVHLSSEYAKRFGFDITNARFELIKGSGAEDELRSLLWQLSRTLNSGEYHELQQYAIATDIFRVLLSECACRQKDETFSSTQVSTRSIKAAMEFIEQHYREDITQSEVAEKLGLHPVYLSVHFKNVTGIGYREYVVRVRLQHALDALLKQGKSVDEAAAIGGFPSKRNFIDKCKRAYNLTPMQLREQSLNSNGGEGNEVFLPNNQI